MCTNLTSATWKDLVAQPFITAHCLPSLSSHQATRIERKRKVTQKDSLESQTPAAQPAVIKGGPYVTLFPSATEVSTYQPAVAEQHQQTGVHKSGSPTNA